MIDSFVTKRFDHNLVINMRRYMRGDHVAPPEPAVFGDRAYSRPVTLPSLIICEAAVVLLA
jgi:hypothetical protein